MSLLARHGDHEHGHGNEDSIRQHAFAKYYWYTLAGILLVGLVRRVISIVIARQR